MQVSEKIQDIIDPVRWAMKSEDIASKLYETLENMADTEEKKSLMRSLSGMEKGHYYTLRVEYELLLNWEMYSQMMRVGL